MEEYVPSLKAGEWIKAAQFVICLKNSAFLTWDSKMASLLERSSNVETQYLENMKCSTVLFTGSSNERWWNGVESAFLPGTSFTWMEQYS